MRERKTELRELVMFLLLRWRGIFLIALGIAILSSGYKTFSTYRKMKDTSRNEEAEREKQRYLDDQANFKSRIDDQQKLLDELNEYQQASVYAKLDPLNVCFSAVTYHVVPETKEDGSPTCNVSNVIKDFQKAFDYGEFEDYKRKGKELEARYIRELIFDIVDYNGGFMTFQFLEEDLETLSGLEEYARKMIDEIKPGIAESRGAFKLEISDETKPANVVSSSALLNYGGSALENLSKQISQQVTNKNNYQNTITSLGKQLRELEEPDEKAIGMADVKRSLIMYFIIGFFAGLVMGVFIYSLAFASDQKFYSDSQINEDTNTYILSSGYSIRKLPFDFIDRMVVKLLGKDSFKLDEKKGKLEFLDITKAQLRHSFERIERAGDDNINNNLGNNPGSEPGNRKICLLSSTKLDLLGEISELLKTSFPEAIILVGTDISTNSAALDDLASSDTVVILEQKNRSRMEGIRRELLMIERMRKPLLGIISI